MSTKSYTTRQKNVLIAQARELLAEGKSLYAACAEIGISQSCMTKWLNPPPPKPPKRIGRPRKLELTAEECTFFQNKILDHESLPVAAELLWRSSETTAETKRALGMVLARAEAEGKRPVWPVALIEASQIPDCIAAMHRGKKHARKLEPKARRNGTMEVDGVVIPWAPGSIYESDDMSLNEPFRFMDSSLRRETAGRQGLFSIDSASGFHLGKTLIGRARDAYRMEDVADHMLSIVEDHGLPLMWRLEKGIWESSLVVGINVKGRSEKWGAMEDLFYVRTKHESTGKANIERSFHQQQKLTAHKSTSIGRERGEFEKGTKLYLRAQEGRPDALSYFWPIEEASAWIDDALKAENLRARRYEKTGFYGTPEDIMNGRTSKQELRDEDRWYFMPIKRQVSVRKGVIEVKVDHYPRSFRFVTMGIEGFPIFQEGHSVLIAFHPGKADELGCYVFNAATGAEARGMVFGQFIGRAELFRDVAEEIIGGTGDFSQIGKARAHMRSVYRGIVPNGTGPGTLKSTARDGLGNALTIQTGGTQADGVVPPPAPQPRREILPAISSRAMPVDAAAEIRRLQAALEEA
jgi:hypothetical protein